MYKQKVTFVQINGFDRPKTITVHFHDLSNLFSLRVINVNEVDNLCLHKQRLAPTASVKTKTVKSRKRKQKRTLSLSLFINRKEVRNRDGVGNWETGRTRQSLPSTTITLYFSIHFSLRMSHCVTLLYTMKRLSCADVPQTKV
jgi:hypothetical protein